MKKILSIFMVAVLSLNLYQPCIAANGEKESDGYLWQKVLAEKQAKRWNTKKKIQNTKQNKSEPKTSFLGLLGRFVLEVIPFAVCALLSYNFAYRDAKRKCDEMLRKGFIDKKKYDDLERTVDNLKQDNKYYSAGQKKCDEMLGKDFIDKKSYDKLKRERDKLEGTVKELKASKEVIAGKFNSCDIDRRSCKSGWDSKVFQANSHAKDLENALVKCYNEVNRWKRDFGSCPKPQQSSQPE